MSVQIQQMVNLTTEECCKCGMVFAMPEQFQKRRRDDGDRFFCPSGHAQVYTKPRIKIIEEQLEEAERKMRAAKCEALNAQSRAQQAEEKLRKQTKRVHAGVCPCCNRSFTNLRRHMATKHKEAQP